jgi:hypothetical protein
MINYDISTIASIAGGQKGYIPTIDARHSSTALLTVLAETLVYTALCLPMKDSIDCQSFMRLSIYSSLLGGYWSSMMM